MKYLAALMIALTLTTTVVEVNVKPQPRETERCDTEQRVKSERCDTDTSSQGFPWLEIIVRSIVDEPEPVGVCIVGGAICIVVGGDQG